MIAEIFESWPAPGKMKTYLDMGARLGPQLEKMDGVISIERFQSFSDLENCWRFPSGALQFAELTAKSSSTVEVDASSLMTESSFAIDGGWTAGKGPGLAELY